MPTECSVLQKLKSYDLKLLVEYSLLSVDLILSETADVTRHKLAINTVAQSIPNQPCCFADGKLQ